MDRHRVAIRRITAVLLVTSAFLIAPSLVGIGASLLLTVSFGVASIALFIVRDSLSAVPTVASYNLGQYASDFWVAGALTTVFLVAFPTATAVELQTLGGVSGFVAMLNYFLTPVYAIAYTLVVGLRRTLKRV
ncbi:hypothetical protein ACFQJ7_00325 [Halovenus rubra]|uniref:Uncharacterized protein n=2 Tax=Halovenus rubra TaxID=869890 RepID=A0ACC7E1N0_9EURY|nr:hypothetical protein [Halovenus rubra]